MWPSLPLLHQPPPATTLYTQTQGLSLLLTGTLAAPERDSDRWAGGLQVLSTQVLSQGYPRHTVLFPDWAFADAVPSLCFSETPSAPCLPSGGFYWSAGWDPSPGKP